MAVWDTLARILGTSHFTVDKSPASSARLLLIACTVAYLAVMFKISAANAGRDSLAAFVTNEIRFCSVPRNSLHHILLHPYWILPHLRTFKYLGECSRKLKAHENKREKYVMELFTKFERYHAVNRHPMIHNTKITKAFTPFTV